MTGTELTVPALRGLSLREVWDLEDKLDDAKALVSDYIDSEVRRLAGEGWTQTRIAEECGRSTSTVSRRMALLGVEPNSNRGRPRISHAGNSTPPAEPRYPEVVQFGIPAEIQETMAASLDAMPEPEREESLAKIRGEHGSWERKDAMATLAGLPPMPRPDQAPPPGSESAIDDLVSAWDEIGAAIRDAREQDRAARGDNALTDSQLYRLDTARERVQEETAIDARPAPDESDGRIPRRDARTRAGGMAALAGLPPMPRPVPDPDAAKASERRQASENLTHCLIPLNPDPLPPVEFADRFVASLGDEFAAFDAARIQKAGEVLLALARRRTEWQ